MASQVIWPEIYLPGTTDNFVTNEVISKGITAEQVWLVLADITAWESYYDNCSQITPPASGPMLKQGDTFSFSTFGFPPLPGDVLESVAPTATTPGRLGWRVQTSGDEDTAINVYHAWIIENLKGGRVRILTQESQLGKPTAEMARQKPNPILNKHQDWLEGLVKETKRRAGVQ